MRVCSPAAAAVRECAGNMARTSSSPPRCWARVPVRLLSSELVAKPPSRPPLDRASIGGHYYVPGRDRVASAPRCAAPARAVAGRAVAVAVPDTRHSTSYYYRPVMYPASAHMPCLIAEENWLAGSLIG